MRCGYAPKDAAAKIGLMGKASDRNHSQETLLRSVGLRTTRARVSVLSALTRSRGPLAAAALIQQLGGPIELTTIYRTLETLTRKGLIHRVRGSDDRAWRYAAGGERPDGSAKAAHRHAHFLCDRCGRIECLSSVAIPAQLDPAKLGAAKLPDRYVMEYAEVVLHGRCGRCRE